METVEDVLRVLRAKASEATRKTLIRHGAPPNTYGVKVADLKLIAKRIRGNQRLAYALYDTGIYDAMYLAGIVADGSQMTKRQLESWAKQATCSTLAEYTVPGVAVESRFARDLALKWLRSKSATLASTGWCSYSGIVATLPDTRLDLDEIQSLLQQVIDQIHTAPNRVRYTMNGFVISVGAYVAPLLTTAKRTASKIGAVKVEMGDTACKVPLATDYITKIEKAGRVGKKRLTFKC